MKLLQELQNTDVRLTQTQQGILALIHAAATPEMAFANTTGTQNVLSARSSLQQLGLVKVGGNKAILTNDGQETLKAYNITDDSNELTDNGQEILDQIEDDKAEWNLIESLN